jgi:hypothetical protein
MVVCTRFVWLGNVSLFVAVLFGLVKPASAGGLDWPADRLLPVFPAPAASIDCINVSRSRGAEADLFASLEGIVNRTQPRIACISRRSGDQGDWLKIHELPNKLLNGFDAVAKYKNEISGLVVTDPDQPDTLNLATTLAGLDNELICAPELLNRLTNAPFNLQIKDDLRGRFTSGAQVYDFVYTNCWPRCTHRVIAGLSGNMHGELRDYLIALKSAVVWFNPRPGSSDATALKQFLGDMEPANCVYLGWWPDEAAGLEYCGQYGVPVMASDFFDNGSLFSGVAQSIAAPAIPPPPPLENKIYLAMIISDGDNVQYMQHSMKRTWNSPARGSVPIGWTVSPLSADLDPGMLNFYYRTATTNDCLVSGPSGAGYTRLNFWNTNFVPAFTQNSDRYLRSSGIRVITVWNKVNKLIADSFATNCPTLLGITSQEGGRRIRLHGNLPVAGFPEHAAYADTVDQMNDAIANAAKEWDGKSPLFVPLQGNAWKIGPEDFQNIANSLDKDKFVVVRPDQLFMLIKESIAAGRTSVTN